jgi:hypothetical protein
MKDKFTLFTVFAAIGLHVGCNNPSDSRASAISQPPLGGWPPGFICDKNQTQLETCLNYDGGSACYTKWCEKGCDPRVYVCEQEPPPGFVCDKNKSQLDVCLKNGGGNACFTQWCQQGNPVGGVPQPDTGFPQPGTGFPQPGTEFPQPWPGVPQPWPGVPQPPWGITPSTHHAGRSTVAPPNACSHVYGVNDPSPSNAFDPHGGPVFICKGRANSVLACSSSTDPKSCYNTGLMSDPW